MKTIRMFTKITVIALAICLLGVLASCGLSGSLQMKSFTVVKNSVKTSYIVGETIDFSDIKAFVVYTDESLNTEYGFADLTIEYPTDITATPGNKEVTVSFMDPHLNVKQVTKVAIIVQEDPSAVKHDSYKVDTSGMKTTYLIGETLDFTGLKLIETFTNGGADVEITDLSGLVYDYDEGITATPGLKSISATYNGENVAPFAINVRNPAITQTTLDTSHVTLEYMQGDTVSIDGLSATITYENNETRTVSTFTSMVDLATLTATYGQKDVIVQLVDPISGNELTSTFQIRVNGLTGYSLDTENMLLQYHVGDEVFFNGIRVTASYFFGNNEDVPFEDLTFVHDDNLTASHGNKQVVVKVGNTEVGSFLITVGDIPVAYPNITNVDCSYRVGETVSMDGLSLDLVYQDSTQDRTVPFEDLIILTDLSTLTQTPGEKEIMVKYLVDEEIPVIAKVLIMVWGIDGYTVDTEAMNTVYIVGGTIDYTGLTVWANYKDRGESVQVDLSTIRFEDKNVTSVAGQKSILLYINDTLIGTISVTVEKNTVVSHKIEGSFQTIVEQTLTPDLTGLTLSLTYADGTVKTFTLDQITVGQIDTSKVGSTSVTLKVTDPINNEVFSTHLSITVIGPKLQVIQYETSESLSQFHAANKTEEKVNYGQSGFGTQFVNQAMYVIGDDNDFRFMPTLAVIENGIPKPLNQFYAAVEMFIYDGSTYVPMTQVIDPQKPTQSSFYHGDVLIMEADTYFGLYDFTKEAIGNRVKFSILPSSTYYLLNNQNPVTLEAEIIDAYNVYNATQLAVVEHSSRSDWTEFKMENGLLGINPAGVVIHNNIHISANDVPQHFLYVTDKDVTYINDATSEKRIVPAGTRYLKDETFIYQRDGSYDFTIQGNFFKLDIINFPLVPSIAIFDEALGYDYGHDFSNATLFVFSNALDWTHPDPGTRAHITIENIGITGNAGRNNYVDEKGGLASAGGLLFLKPRYYAEVTVNNSYTNSFFIPFLPDLNSEMNLNDVKCYDSYQNALFVWGSANCKVNNSYLNGAGGPLIIAQDVERDDQWYHPTVILNNTITETHVTGEEIWFNALGVSGLVSNIKALGNGFAQTGAGNFVDKNNKMNIIGTVIADKDDSSIDAMGMLTAYDVQATMLINGHGVERWLDSDEWNKIRRHLAFENQAPYLSVTDEQGKIHTVYFDGATFRDLNNNGLGTQLEHMALLDAFQSADYITLTQGGLSIVLEFYH